MLTLTGTAFFRAVLLLTSALIVYAEFVSVSIRFARKCRIAAVEIAFKLLTGCRLGMHKS
jgi:hypothetical protein